MDKGFIMNDESIEIISEEEIIKKIFEACPQIVFLSRLLSLDSWWRSTNTAIVDLLECYPEFKGIIEKEFIEVCEDTSFDYDYGDISDTHHEITCIGYARRKDINEEDIKYVWDMWF